MKQLCCYVLSFRPSISLFGIELQLVQEPLVNYMKACGCWMGLLAFLTTKQVVSYGPSALDLACCFSDAFLALSEGLSQSINAWSPQIHLNLCKSSSFHHFFQKKVFPSGCNGEATSREIVGCKKTQLSKGADHHGSRWPSCGVKKEGLLIYRSIWQSPLGIPMFLEGIITGFIKLSF